MNDDFVALQIQRIQNKQISERDNRTIAQIRDEMITRYEAAEQLPRLLCPVCRKPTVLDLPEFRSKPCELCEREAEAADQQRAADIAITSSLRASGIPLKFWNCTFDNYLPVTESQRRAKILLSSLPPFHGGTKGGKGALLYGDPSSPDRDNAGVGKTHLACAAGIERIKRGRFVNFVRARSRELEQIFWKKEPFDHLAHCDLLILDDVTAERARNAPEHWVAGINEIVAQVYDENRCSLIITSNMLYAQAGYSLRTTFGERMISRLAEITQAISISGPDHRLGK